MVCSVRSASLRNRLVATRESAGMPCRYRSVSRPWASGEKAMQPAPTDSSVSSSRSSSIHRLIMEYDGWWISSGVPSSRRIAAACSVCAAV